MVGRLGAAFVRGVEEHGGIATGKHFPGHGDTGTDSHLSLPTIRVSRARMDSVELRPFREAIDAGMGAIMTAHISVPSLNGGVREPSTLSPLVLTSVLRDELGFDGIGQAMSGSMYLSGSPGEPTKAYVPWVDFGTAGLAAFATVAALHARNASGRGQHVDIGLLDVQVAMLANQAMNYLATGLPASGDKPRR